MKISSQTNRSAPQERSHQPKTARGENSGKIIGTFLVKTSVRHPTFRKLILNKQTTRVYIACVVSLGVCVCCVCERERESGGRTVSVLFCLPHFLVFFGEPASRLLVPIEVISKLIQRNARQYLISSECVIFGNRK